MDDKAGMNSSQQHSDMLAQAFALHERGQFDKAAAIYQDILKTNPRNPDALYLLGAVHHQWNNPQEAIRLIEYSLGVNPNQPAALNILGLSWYSLRRYDEALAQYKKAMVMAPDFVDVYNNMGNLLDDMKRYPEAIRCFEKAIALKPPSLPALYSNRACVLQKMKRNDEALADYQKAVALHPGYMEAYYNMGNLLQDMRRYRDALESYNKAIGCNPNVAVVYNNRGTVLKLLKRHDEAMADFDKAIALNPSYAEPYSNKGKLLYVLKRYEEALAHKEKALSLNIQSPYLVGDIIHARMSLGDWRDLETNRQVLADQINAGKPITGPFTMLPLTTSIALQRKAAEIQVQDRFPPSDNPLWKGEVYKHEKIRVAYVSPDFGHHPLSILMVGAFEQHDRTRVETWGISLTPEDASEMGQRVKRSFDHYIDVSEKDEKEIAQLLRELEIDVALDLAGATTGNKTDIFALRPAPVQINYLGYPGTMGAPYLDYIIADAFTIPQESAPEYTEKVIYMPYCFQANDDKRPHGEEPLARTAYGLPESGFVFCAFNITYKILPEMFSLWMRILEAVPGSVLWLLGGETVRRHLRAEAQNRGMDPARLVFADRMKYAHYLARFTRADLFLDTLPFNAGATASDALWTGVPVLTCTGEAFASRMAGSLLTTMGLPELITHNLEDYEKRAIELATNPEKLSALRERLAANRKTSPLFDTARFTRNLEKAYEMACQRVHEKLPPENLFI